MDNIVNLLTDGLLLAPEYIFIARCITLTLAVEVLSSLVQLGAGFAKTVSR